jgi:hypothetical protein
MTDGARHFVTFSRPPPSPRLRLPQRQHQPVGPGEHRDRVGEVGDFGIGEAGAAQGCDFGFTGT